MLGWGWPLFANSSSGEGGTVAAATPQRVGKVGATLPPNTLAD